MKSKSRVLAVEKDVGEVFASLSEALLVARAAVGSVMAAEQRAGGCVPVSRAAGEMLRASVMDAGKVLDSPDMMKLYNFVDLSTPEERARRPHVPECRMSLEEPLKEAALEARGCGEKMAPLHQRLYDAVWKEPATCRSRAGQEGSV